MASLRACGSAGLGRLLGSASPSGMSGGTLPRQLMGESLMAAPPAPVPPLSSYLAKRCPRRVQLDLVEPAVPLEPTADVQERLDEGIAFEASVVAELREVAASDWVFVDETASPGLQVEATTSAIAAEAGTIRQRASPAACTAPSLW